MSESTAIAPVSPAPSQFDASTPIAFDTTATGLAELRTKYGGLTLEHAQQSSAGYQMVVKAIADCRTRRVAVEKRRKEIKADAIAFGKRVDAVAKEIVDGLEEIELPLISIRQRIDAAKEAEKQAKQEAERQRILEEARKQREAQEAEAARLKAERDAAEAVERERVRKEQEAEAARLAEERRKLEEERAAERQRLAAEQAARDAELAAERERLAVQQREIDVEKERLAAIERERRAKEDAELEERRRIERERIEAEERAAEAKRREELRPDVEKLEAWAGMVRDAAKLGPHLAAEEAQIEWLAAFNRIASSLDSLEEYCVAVRMDPDTTKAVA